MMKLHTVLVLALLPLSSMAQVSYVWQHTDVMNAWRSGFKGQGTTVHVHDQFNGAPTSVDLNPGLALNQYATHGGMVSEVVRRTAPLANIERRQWINGNISLQAGRLNVINASYALIDSTNAGVVGFVRNQMQLAPLAHAGAAVVVKAAGNSATSLSSVGGTGDVLNIALKGAKSVIFAGALQSHSTQASTIRLGRWSFSVGGTVASKAWYSNTPGSDPEYQSKFLMVGVPSNMTVAGTSFAAPQISAYAAMVGSKFTQATPEQVTNQLLNTARQDTIRGYNRAEHGMGEASLSRALAPVAIR